MIRHFLYFLPILFTGITYSQQSFVFQHLTTKDGLASAIITGILHDSRGYSWVGTNKGLQKFDGINFTSIPYGREYFFTPVINATTFQPLLEDKMGGIWVKIFDHTTIYHPLTGKISRIEIYDDKNNDGVNNIKSFCKDDVGDVWIITSLNLYKYDHHLQRPVYGPHWEKHPLCPPILFLIRQRKVFGLSGTGRSFS